VGQAGQDSPQPGTPLGTLDKGSQSERVSWDMRRPQLKTHVLRGICRDWSPVVDILPHSSLRIMYSRPSVVIYLLAQLSIALLEWRREQVKFDTSKE
jgi:hypothetical protein